MKQSNHELIAKLNKQLRQMIDRLPQSQLPAVIVVVLIGFIGVSFLYNSHASTPAVGVETEKGNGTGCRSVVNDSDSSNAKSLKFGACPGTGFTHPGIYMSKSQLDFVKTKLAANATPWTTSYASMLTDKAIDGVKLADTAYSPSPVHQLECLGASQSTQQHALNAACQAQVDDSEAAYALALMWYMKGDSAAASKAIQILNTWVTSFTPTGNLKYCNDVTGTDTNGKFWDSINNRETDPTLGANNAIGYYPDYPETDCTGIVFDQTYNNGLLQASWSGLNFVRAAELLRYSGAGWSSTSVTKFTTMLNEVYLPLVNHNWTGGANWLAAMADLNISIGVFENDRTTYNQGIAQWQHMLPAVVYMSSDDGSNCTGNTQDLTNYPIQPFFNGKCVDKTQAALNNSWHDPGQYVDGLEEETCRDIEHATWGLDGMVSGAETARIQGTNLYTTANLNRMVTAYEFNAKNFNASLAGTSLPASWLCGTGKLDNNSNIGYQAAWELGYNALHDRKGATMPNSLAMITGHTRGSGSEAVEFMNFEQLLFQNNTAF